MNNKMIQRLIFCAGLLSTLGGQAAVLSPNSEILANSVDVVQEDEGDAPTPKSVDDIIPPDDAPLEDDDPEAL